MPEAIPFIRGGLLAFIGGMFNKNWKITLNERDVIPKNVECLSHSSNSLAQRQLKKIFRIFLGKRHTRNGQGGVKPPRLDGG